MNCILQSNADPKHVARTIARVGIGLALAFAGLSHYRNPDAYASFVSQDLGLLLTPLGYLWGILLPALLILGGVLLAFGIYLHVAAAAVMTALVSMPAGMMLKAVFVRNDPSSFFLNEALPLATFSIIWIIAVLLVVGGRCCVVEQKGVAVALAKKPLIAPVKKVAVSPVVAKKKK